MISSRNMEYLGIYLMKHVKDLYNDKLLLYYLVKRNKTYSKIHMAIQKS